MQNRLIKIDLIINNYCNMDCIYCYNRTDVDKPCKFDMNISVIKLLVMYINRHMQDVDVRYFLSGGETLLYPYLVEMVEELQKTKNLESIVIVTNGTVPLPDFKSYDKLKFTMSFHYDTMLRYNYDALTKIFKTNIKKMLDNNILDVVWIMSSNNNLAKNKILNLINDERISSYIYIKCIYNTDFYKSDNPSEIKYCSPPHFNLNMYTHTEE